MFFVNKDSPILLKKSLRNKTKCRKNRGFHDSLKYLLFTSQFFALFPLNGVLESNYRKMYFSWFTIRTLYALIVSWAAILEGIWCAYFLAQTNDPFEIYELNVVMFYSRGTLTCLAFLKLAKNWPALMEEFDNIENMLRSYPPSKFLHTKLRIITFAIFFAAAVQVLNMFITFGWTFIDVFIVYASINFSEKIVQLNKQISLTVEKQVESPVVWRSLRENYTRLLHLFANFNDKLDNIILVSFASNIFFLLTQLFAWMRLNATDEIALQHIYFLFSIFLLIIRTSFVCFYGASIQEESQNLINNLVTTPSNLYNEEVERFIVQVSTSPMILSGSKYFRITRSLILKIAGSIVTYELVMIQFSENISKKGGGSPC
ncbi:gustatory receptor for sugar taste 64f [Coccinella septempunctata]|uniref:gustatory receptor for sugar taste 64f n=1 Tax=Coccinella septempunctata TaxID=41139 RepID=UPI001D074183|nr:gustatory receptor for sugar taste 64f [Coccinella septempunctata]